MNILFTKESLNGNLEGNYRLLAIDLNENFFFIEAMY